jgi:hypothetical protein
MTRAILYKEAKDLATTLNLDLRPLKAKWRKSTKKYWESKINQYKKNIKTSILKDEISTKARKKKFSRFVNTLTKFKQFHAVFKVVKNNNYKLTKTQANNLYNKMVSTGYYRAKVILADGQELIMPINKSLSSNENFILNFLTQGGIVLEEGQTYGSDRIQDINFNEIVDIKISKLRKPKKAIKNKDGRFFTYINTTNLDLSYYQIYNQEQASSGGGNREHCLIDCLLKSNIDKAKVNNVKLSFKCGANFSKKDFKKITQIINSNITLHYYDEKKGEIRKNKYKHNSENNIDIAIYEHHYFIFEKTIYSSYFIKNYEELKDIEDPFNIVKKGKGKYYIRDEGRKINSLLLVHNLFKFGLFKKLDFSNFPENSSNAKTRDHIYLDNIENEQNYILSTEEKIRIALAEKGRPIDDDEEIEVKRKKLNIFYADSETFVNGEHHKLYLLGVVSQKNDNVIIYNTQDEKYLGNNKEQKTIYDFLNYITNNGKQDAVVYFHNLKYDYIVMRNYLNIINQVKKDNSIYSIEIMHKKRKIELRDSYKIISMPLSKFQKQLNLDEKFNKKEAIAYVYYTEKNNNKMVKTEIYKELLSKEDQIIFDNQIKYEPSYNAANKTFNPTSYYKDYLKLDCLVLKKGLEKFNSIIKDITKGKLEVYDKLTISSLTDEYMLSRDVYKGVYEMTGNLRHYCSQAVYGGRVCTNKKYEKKILTENKISDYDGVSLYPSAINRLCREIGLPTGPAKRYTKNDLINWKNKIYSIMTVKIKKVNKTQQMPFIAYKNEDNILEYTNEAPKDNIIIDSITLEDYINFHKIDYEIIDGVYWDEDVNKKMAVVINELFNQRLKYKKSNPALANILKLMLNSSYGKTIIKKSKFETNIINAHINEKKDDKWIRKENEGLNNYIYSNFNTIKTINKLNDNNYEIEKLSVDTSYNRAHIGCAILSMSKRIMNEVFNIANDNNYPIYYTDTDSLHCNLEDVSRLEAKYKEKYNKELNGKQLEQFHTDFDLDGATTEIYATKSIFLGKKSYLDVLESKNEKGEIIKGFHIRLKGITTEGLLDASKRYKNSYEGLYEDLSEGKEIDFILNPYNEEENKYKVLFEYDKLGVKTKNEFHRVVKF